MGVCDVPVIHEVCNTAGDAAGAVVTAPFEWLAQGMGGAAEWMFTSVWKVIDTTTFVDVTSGEYTKVYNIMFGVGVFVMLGFFMLQVIGGMIRREPAALSRAALGIAKSILGSFVAVALLGTATLSPISFMLVPAALTMPMHSWSVISSAVPRSARATNDPRIDFAIPSAALESAAGSRRIIPPMTWSTNKPNITKTATPNMML